MCLDITEKGKEPQEAQEAQEKGVLVPLVLLVVPSPFSFRAQSIEYMVRPESTFG
jgi:hypothetical protein